MRTLIFLLVAVSFAAASNRTEPCPAEGEFRCRSSGRCIPELWLCDGARDCAEGEDESEWRCHRHNHTRCAGDQPECGMPDGTFRCILHQWLCDGHDDCEDGSDERDCETRPPDLPSSGHLVDSSLPPKCSSSEFRCATGSCISRDLVCDDVPHCSDGSDESEERCAMPPRIAPPEPKVEPEDGTNATMPWHETMAGIRDSEGPLFIDQLNGTMKEPEVLPTNRTKEESEPVGNPMEPETITVVAGTSLPSTTMTTPNNSVVPHPLDPTPQFRADSAFQPQIEVVDPGTGPEEAANHTLVPTQEEKDPVEDGNLALPDPFPFDLANYEIPEAEDPEEGHDEMGGTGTGAVPTPGTMEVPNGSGSAPIQPGPGSMVPVPSGSGAAPIQPGSGSKIAGETPAAEKAVEELQLANVLQFMSNETKKILKSINATKGHAVHSYKTVRNKSEVHSLSSYHHLPGLYAKLLPYEEVTNKNDSDASVRSQGRVRRHPVRFRATQYTPHLGDVKSKRQAEEENKEKDTPKEEKEKESTLPPIIPLQLPPLEGAPIAPIVPANAAEENPTGTKESGTEPKQKETGPAQPEPAMKVVEKEDIGAGTNGTKAAPGVQLGTNEDPKEGSGTVDGPSGLGRQRSGPGSSDAMLTRSERLIIDGGRERIVVDERPKKERPARVERDKYEDDGEGAME